MQVDAFLSFTIAVILLLSGKIATMNAGILRRYSIPEPVVGGLLCAAVVALVFALTGDKIVFELGMRDFLLLLFFAGIGLKADVLGHFGGGGGVVVDAGGGGFTGEGGASVDRAGGTGPQEERPS